MKNKDVELIEYTYHSTCSEHNQKTIFSFIVISIGFKSITLMKIHLFPYIYIRIVAGNQGFIFGTQKILNLSIVQ